MGGCCFYVPFSTRIKGYSQTNDTRMFMGVLFGCFGRNVDGPGLPGGLYNDLPGPSISPKRTPMAMFLLSQAALLPAVAGRAVC